MGARFRGRYDRTLPGLRARAVRRRSSSSIPRFPRIPRLPRRVLAVAGVGALAWTGHGLVRTALSRAFEPEPPPAPTVVRCVMEPLRIPPLSCTSAILVEAETGSVLYAQNPDEPRAPASLVKMMLQLLVYEELEAGRLEPETCVRASRNASTMGGSQVFLAEGEERTVSELLDAVAIASANDASMALAEHIAGSEAECVERMNARAREIGCRQTTFANVHGLDLRGQAKNTTSARDLATIARALARHPRALQVAGTRRKAFRGGDFILDNTNHLLGRFPGLDGLKTGWTPRAGGCFVATAERDGVRLIAVVLAAVPGPSRFRVAGKLLAAGYDVHPLWREVARAGDVVAGAGPVPADPGEGDASSAAVGGTVRLLVERDRADRISARLRTSPPRAKTAEEEPPVWVDFRLDGRTVATVPARPSRRG